MADLTKFRSNDRLAQAVVDNMYEAAAQARKKGAPRTYLGMSEIGKPCDRELWYNFRCYPRIDIEGRIIMLFEFGDMIEDRVVHWLREAGYDVAGQQLAFKSHNDLFRGHCDGTIEGVTKKMHILEVKSANKKKFDAFKRHGVRKTYPVYYSQVQCYMGYSSLERSLHIVQCKDTSEIYAERTYFNQSDFNALHDRAYHIITANQAPDRPFSENSFECKYCDQRLTCYHPNEAIMNQVCGTCHFFGFHGLDKYCWHPNHPFKLETTIGCPDWNDRYEKCLPGDELKYEKVTAENLTVYDAGRGAGVAG
jgi:hypothetical protein